MIYKTSRIRIVNQKCTVTAIARPAEMEVGQMVFPQAQEFIRVYRNLNFDTFKTDFTNVS